MQKDNEPIKNKASTFGGMDARNNIEFHEYDNAWIGEVVSRIWRKNQKVKCYNCSKGHFKRDCRLGIPRNNIFSNNNPFRMPLPSGLCRCGKGRKWTNKCRSMRKSHLMGFLAERAGQSWTCWTFPEAELDGEHQRPETQTSPPATGKKHTY